MGSIIIISSLIRRGPWACGKSPKLLCFLVKVSTALITIDDGSYILKPMCFNIFVISRSRALKFELRRRNVWPIFCLNQPAFLFHLKTSFACVIHHLIDMSFPPPPHHHHHLHHHHCCLFTSSSLLLLT